MLNTRTRAFHLGSRILVVVILGFTVVILGFIWPRAVAEDAAAALLRCKEQCTGNLGTVRATLERRNGEWQVTGLSVFSNRLPSSDFKRLAVLRDLDTLNLYNDGHVPSRAIEKLSALPRLRRVVLTGPVTADDIRVMSTFAQLEDLDVSIRSIGEDELESEAFGQLTKLRALRRLALGYRGGGLSDETLEFIKPLEQLEELDLSITGHITDVGLAKLRGLRELRILELEMLGATGLSAIEELPQLERLSIGTFVPTDRKADFSGLEHLKWLSLDTLAPGREIDIRLPPNLRGLTLSEWWFHRKRRFNLLPALSQLESLRLEFPARCAPDSRRINLHWLGDLSELRELTLDDAIDTDLMSLPDLPSLRTLETSGQYGLISEAGLKTIVSRLPHLESLRTMTGWLVTDAGMEPLRTMTSLRRLELEYTFGLSEKGLASIWELKDLRGLHVVLDDESLQGPVAGVVARLASLKELEELWLGGNLSDENLRQLADLKKLRSLDLTYCKGFTDEALASLMDELPCLTTLKYTAR